MDHWQFAVGIDELYTAGANGNDLRRLIATEHIAHAIEVLRPEAGERSFIRVANLGLSGDSAFVLTQLGLRYVRTLRSRTETAETPGCLSPEATHERMPIWNSARRELHCRGILVKRFAVPAPSQEVILSAFQEEAWPDHIDDPLPYIVGLDPAQRLHQAVRGLNRNQRQKLLTFHRDGRGMGVCWLANDRAFHDTVDSVGATA